MGSSYLIFNNKKKEVLSRISLCFANKAFLIFLHGNFMILTVALNSVLYVRFYVYLLD